MDDLSITYIVISIIFLVILGYRLKKYKYQKINSQTIK